MKFELQTVVIWRGTVQEARKEEHLAMVGVGTNLAYLRPLEGSLLQRRYPDAWVVVDTNTGGHVTSFPLPADEETCQKLIEYLSTVEHNHFTRHDLIKKFAVTQGQWIWRMPSSASK